MDEPHQEQAEHHHGPKVESVRVDVWRQFFEERRPADHQPVAERVDQPDGNGSDDGEGEDCARFLHQGHLAGLQLTTAGSGQA